MEFGACSRINAEETMPLRVSSKVGIGDVKEDAWYKFLVCAVEARVVRAKMRLHSLDEEFGSVTVSISEPIEAARVEFGDGKIKEKFKNGDWIVLH